MTELGTDEERTALRELLRQVRKERGVTQVELAALLQVHQSLISDYESGKRRVDLVELSAICDALGISLRTFCRRWQAAT